MDLEKLKELHLQGLNDAEIAEALHVTPEGICYQRKRLGIPANKRSRRGKVVDGTRTHNHDQFRKLYDEGYTDLHIARTVGVKMQAVKTWRYRSGNLSENITIAGGSKTHVAICVNDDPEALLAWKLQPKEVPPDKPKMRANARVRKIGNRKLTGNQALEIYELAWKGELTLQEIADNYGISDACVSSIKFGRSWSHITNQIRVISHGQQKR